MCKVNITEQSCGCKEYIELRVAFGNLDNCQLKCPFCFTVEQKPSSYILSSLSGRNMDNVRLIRFTGGEPLLLQNQIDSIVDQLQRIERYHPKNLDLIVVQTNAISVETKNIDGLFKLELPILFEVSFKGTNSREYQYLTHQNSIKPMQANNIMEKQFEGYDYISARCSGEKRIGLLARLGIFHSSVKEPTFKFIFTDTKELMFNPEHWSPEFRHVLFDQIKVWDSIFERKFVVERIKTPADGTPGIGRRYRTIIESLKDKRLLQESKSKLPDIYLRNYFYARGNDVYWRCADYLRTANMGKAVQ